MTANTTDECPVAEHLEERMRSAEDRLASLETIGAKVPQIESRVLRIERLMMEIQGDMRRAEKAATDFQLRVDAKLDAIVDLLTKG